MNMSLLGAGYTPIDWSVPQANILAEVGGAVTAGLAILAVTVAVIMGIRYFLKIAKKG